MRWSWRGKISTFFPLFSLTYGQFWHFILKSIIRTHDRKIRRFVQSKKCAWEGKFGDSYKKVKKIRRFVQSENCAMENSFWKFGDSYSRKNVHENVSSEIRTAVLQFGDSYSRKTVHENVSSEIRPAVLPNQSEWKKNDLLAHSFSTARISESYVHESPNRPFRRFVQSKKCTHSRKSVQSEICWV